MAQVSTYANGKRSGLAAFLRRLDPVMTGIATALTPVHPRLLIWNAHEAAIVAQLQEAAEQQKAWEQILGPLEELETTQHNTCDYQAPPSKNDKSPVA